MCPYFEKFSGDANPSMNDLHVDKTGFLNSFKSWEVGGVSDPNDEYESRYASSRQESLEIAFEVEISGQNSGDNPKGTMDSYTLSIDSQWNSFVPWDHFQVKSSSYDNTGNGCSRSHSIPQITLYQCTPINVKDGGYGASDDWIVFRLIHKTGSFCLSVSSIDLGHMVS